MAKVVDISEIKMSRRLKRNECVACSTVSMLMHLLQILLCFVSARSKLEIYNKVYSLYLLS